MAKTQTNAPAKAALVYAPVDGQRHVDALRAMLDAGHSTDAILDAYTAARLPEFKARKAYAGKDEKAVTKLVRKHGRTHLTLALAQLNPITAQEALGKAEEAEARALRALESAKARKATAQAAIAKQQAKAS